MTGLLFLIMNDMKASPGTILLVLAAIVIDVAIYFYGLGGLWYHLVR